MDTSRIKSELARPSAPIPLTDESLFNSSFVQGKCIGDVILEDIIFGVTDMRTLPHAVDTAEDIQNGVVDQSNDVRVSNLEVVARTISNLQAKTNENVE